jgi:WD40 repeat protein
MAIKRTAILLINTAIVLLAITQCQDINLNSIAPTWTPPNQEPEIVSDLQAVTPLPQPTEMKQIGCVAPPVLISDGNIREFRWSDNSEQVVYREKEGQIWYSYDTTSDQTVSVTTEISSTPTNDPQRLGISDLLDAYISPSHKMIVFTRGTPEKQDIYYKYINEEQEIFLGTIQGYIKKVDWLANEERAIIAMDWQAPIGIPEAHVYTINFSRNELTIEMPRMNDYKNIEYLGFTPDETRIMFVSYLNDVHLDRTVKLWSISTHEITSTPIFNPFDFIWISRGVLMSVGPQNADSSSRISVLLYDINNLQLTYLAEEKFNIDPFIINAVQISPDGSAIAYIENETDHLYWVICQY